MARIVNVPGMGDVEFPDDMTDEQIAAVLKRQATPASGGFKDFGQGLASSAQGAYRGVRDAAVNLAMIGSPERVNIDTDLRKIEDRRRLDNPIPASGAGTAGAVTGGLLTSIPLLAAGATSLPATVGLGALYGAVQPVGTKDSRTENAMIGGATSGLTAGALKLLGRFAQPVKNVLSADEQAAVELLRGQGVPLSVGQQTGSRAAQAVERGLADNPITSPAMGRAAERQGQAFTTAAMRTAGESADNASPVVMNSAKQRIVGVLDDVESRYAADVNQMLPDLADLASQAERMANDGQPIARHINHIIEKAAANGGKLDGTVVAKLRTEIAPLRRNPVVGGLANDLEEILSSGLEQAMQGTDDFARYATARGQYRNLMSIADTVDTTARAQVSPAKLASRQNSSRYTKSSFRFGTGDTELADIARAGSTVVDRFPNSGTAARAGAQLIPAAGAAGIGLATGERDPVQLAQWAAMGYFGPKAAVAAMTNPAIANYLARGIALPPAMQQAGLLAQRTLPYMATGGLLSQSGY